MGKSEIRVSCNDQVLKITEAPVLAAGGLNEVRIVFSFCQKWAGFIKTAIFYRDKEEVEEVYYAVLNENGTCVVPWEVCFEEGTFYFGVFGEKDDIRRTSNVVRYKVKKGSVTSDMMPSEPSPGVYDQIISEIGKIAYIRACTYTGEILKTGMFTYLLDESLFPGGDPKTGDLFVTATGFVCRVEDASYGLNSAGNQHATILYSLVADINGSDGEKGETGDTGVGIKSIENANLPDVAYNLLIIQLTDGRQEEFIVWNGSKGDKGDKGDTGEQGIQGEPGAKGDKGEIGTSIMTITVEEV